MRWCVLIEGVSDCIFFFSSRRRHTRFTSDWSSDVCSSDLAKGGILIAIAKKYKLPIIALGLGEKEDDLQIFKAEQFAEAFIATN